MLNERTPDGKPVLTFDLGGPASGSLIAMSYLSALKDGASYHEHRGTRHPLGIYNISVTRICRKIQKCSTKLEEYFLLPPSISDIEKHNVLRDEIMDLLELCLYAAAEHVDDVELIGMSFFEDPQQFKKSPHTKALNRAVKPLRDKIASVTNVIKHTQGRLRLFTLEVNHAGIDICLHGFFVEGFMDGSVAPSPILYANNKVISSITTILWDMLIYLGLISWEISNLLEAITAIDKNCIVPAGSPLLRDAVIALARLPLYSFDEVHPFARVRLVLNCDDELRSKMRSSLYGSVMNGWSMSDQIRFGKSGSLIEGDGVSKRFTLPHPSQLHLQHWL